VQTSAAIGDLICVRAEIAPTTSTRRRGRLGVASTHRHSAFTLGVASTPPRRYFGRVFAGLVADGTTAPAEKAPQ